MRLTLSGWSRTVKDDLVQVYALMLVQGQQGHVYNAATSHGVPIGTLSRVIAKRLGISSDLIFCDTNTAIDEIGSWPEGYAIDQQMSGEKAGLHPG